MKAANEVLNARKKELEKQLETESMNLTATHVAIAELKQINDSLDTVKGFKKGKKDEEPTA